MNTMKTIRAKGLVIFLLCLLVLSFLVQKWIPYYEEYDKIKVYTFINWENQLIFLFISLVIMAFIAISIGSLLAVILNRHHCNVEFYTLLGFFVGFTFGGFAMMLCVIFSQDLFGLNILFYSLMSGSSMGMIVGIQNEIEDDERVC